MRSLSIDLVGIDSERCDLLSGESISSSDSSSSDDNNFTRRHRRISRLSKLKRRASSTALYIENSFLTLSNFKVALSFVLWWMCYMVSALDLVLFCDADWKFYYLCTSLRYAQYSILRLLLILHSIRCTIMFNTTQITVYGNIRRISRIYALSPHSQGRAQCIARLWIRPDSILLPAHTAYSSWQCSKRGIVYPLCNNFFRRRFAMEAAIPSRDWTAHLGRRWSSHSATIVPSQLLTLCYTDQYGGYDRTATTKPQMYQPSTLSGNI